MKYPHRIKDGPQEVVIYRSQERGRVRFKIAYSVDGSRKLVSRDDETEAHRDARRALTMLLNRPTVFAQSEDAGIFRAAQSALLPFAGVGVDEACRDYARARKALNGTSPSKTTGTSRNSSSATSRNWTSTRAGPTSTRCAAACAGLPAASASAR